MKYKELKKENKELKERVAVYEILVESARDNNKSLYDYIQKLEKQLAQQDKAIERKDAQWLGLRMAFQDSLINGFRD